MVSTIKMLEDNTDELLQAVYLFSFAVLTGAVGSFTVLPDRTAGPLFDLSASFFTIGDPATSGFVISWAGALAILSGLVIFVTNVGLDAMVSPPDRTDTDEWALALGVIGIPLTIAGDFFSIASNHLAGAPVLQVVVVALVTVGVFVLADQ